MKPIEVEIFENVLDIAIYLTNLMMSGVKNLVNVSVSLCKQNVANYFLFILDF